MKKAWMSKTIWFNLLAGIAGVVGIWVPEVKSIFSEGNFALAIPFINLILRSVTKGKIEFF